MHDQQGEPALTKGLTTLRGIRVLDFGHTVMGPTAGLILADLGAEVIRIEASPDGDQTRKLKGFGTGYFPFFNRNKKSVSINLKTEAGLQLAQRLIATADVLIENFGPGTMDRLGLGYESLKPIHPRLIYLSLKGFSRGPYQDRVALDEIVQMMSGLAYMTGPPGQPLRAGSSVVDITGGMFGVIAVQAAIAERERTGQGQKVGADLFGSAMFLMGQHLAYAALSDAPIPPMPARISAWAIYDQFTTEDGARVFLGITSDRHWKRFCNVFEASELAADTSLATNNQRIDARERLLPAITSMIANMSLETFCERAERATLPFAPIARPEQLFDDPHLNATDGLLPTRLPGGTEAKLPIVPLSMDGEYPTLRSHPPTLGCDTQAILSELGLCEDEIRTLADTQVITLGHTGEGEK